MDKKTKRDLWEEYFDGFEFEDEDRPLFADGLDEAIIGVNYNTNVVIYSFNTTINLLMKQGMTYEEAIEYFNFNIAGAYVGEMTPVWCNDVFY